VAENPLIRSRYAGLAQGAAEAAVEDAQPLAKNAYKIPLFRGVIEEELQRMSRPEAA
jgi:CO/xanthine dehydrogenase FAD-binding subunit